MRGRKPRLFQIIEIILNSKIKKIERLQPKTVTVRSANFDPRENQIDRSGIQDQNIKTLLNFNGFQILELPSSSLVSFGSTAP